MKFKDILTKYSDNNQFLNNLEIKRLKRIGIFIFAYLISFLLFFSPVVVTYQFMMYRFYEKLVLLALCLLFVGFFTVGEILYHRLLIHFSNSEKRSFASNHIINSIIYLVFCLIAYLIIVFIFK